MNPLPEIIQSFLHANPYYPCLLLVHPRIERLHAVADELLNLYSWPNLSIGEELSRSLLQVEPRRRPRTAARWLETRLLDFAPGPLLCTEIDLLFEPSLQLDAPTLLRSASRRTHLVTLWPGTYQSGTLSYAIPEHAHFHTWHDLQLPIESLS